MEFIRALPWHHVNMSAAGAFVDDLKISKKVNKLIQHTTHIPGIICYVKTHKLAGNKMKTIITKTHLHSCFSRISNVH